MTLSPAQLAHQDARRMALVLSEVCVVGVPIDSGWMACDPQGSWANFAAGLGLDGPVDSSDLDALVDFYRTRERTPRIQTTPYQHASLHEGLIDRGFTLHETETVLARGLDDIPTAADIEGLNFRPVDPACDDDVTTFCESHMAGFFEDTEPPAEMWHAIKRMVRSPRVRFWLFEFAGHIVGSGGLEIYEDAGVLIGACVHPKARDQGIHSAFIRFRMKQAKQAGLRNVTVVSLAGGATERNALKAGFSQVYTQTRLRKLTT